MEFWQAIKNLEGQTLRTLDQGRPFEILSVTGKSVIITPLRTGKERTIHRKELDGAHRELTILGHISRIRIEEEYSPRNPAFVAAILSKLDGVVYTLKTIELKIKKGY